MVQRARPMAKFCLLALFLWGIHLSYAKRCAVPRYYLLNNLTSQSKSTRALQVLNAQKRHAIGLVAATGPSAGRLTSSQADILQSSMDVWGMNQFFLHDFLGVFHADAFNQKNCELTAHYCTGNAQYRISTTSR